MILPPIKISTHPLRFIFITFGIYISFLTHAQAPIEAYELDYNKAEEAFANKRYYTAAGLYQKAYKRMKTAEIRQQTLYKIAESYRRSNNFSMAIKWYEEVVNSKYPDPNVIYSYGQLMKNFERYEEAARQFYDYSFEMPADARGKLAQQSCKVAQQWKEHPEKFEIINLKDINSDASDYSPTLNKNELVWASARKESQGKELFEWTGQRYSDFYVSTNVNAAFSKPQSLPGAINTAFNEGVACFDSSGKTMYFTQCNSADGRGMGCKIYMSMNKGIGWELPTPLNFNSDSFNCGHPALSVDGKRIFFASDMPGGLGEKDIYYSDFNSANQTWGNPINLGSHVNTSEDDMFPSVDENGNVYFASKGRIGMGGLDIYKSVDSAGIYTEAQNLKYPINSGADDFSLTLIPNKYKTNSLDWAYFSSNRVDGKGDDDIYLARIKPYQVLVKASVIDRESKQGLIAQVQFTTLKKENNINITSSDKGECNTELKLGNLYTIKASRNGYFTSNEMIISTKDITKDTLIVLQLLLDPIPPPEYDFTLQGVYYDIDKANLRPESKTVLDSLVKILNNNPGLIIELASHTDSRAPADYNLDLSKRRAKSCVDYLVSKGISKSRLVPVGYGETKLVNDCADGVDCSEEEHQQNRRTTFRVLKNNTDK